jgi:hypothetical protein
MPVGVAFSLQDDDAAAFLKVAERTEDVLV